MKQDSLQSFLKKLDDIQKYYTRNPDLEEGPVCHERSSLIWIRANWMNILKSWISLETSTGASTLTFTLAIPNISISLRSRSMFFWRLDSSWLVSTMLITWVFSTNSTLFLWKQSWITYSTIRPLYGSRTTLFTFNHFMIILFIISSVSNLCLRSRDSFRIWFLRLKRNGHEAMYAFPSSLLMLLVGGLGYPSSCGWCGFVHLWFHRGSWISRYGFYCFSLYMA